MGMWRLCVCVFFSSSVSRLTHCNLRLFATSYLVFFLAHRDTHRLHCTECTRHTRASVYCAVLSFFGMKKKMCNVCALWPKFRYKNERWTKKRRGKKTTKISFTKREKKRKNKNIICYSSRGYRTQQIYAFLLSRLFISSFLPRIVESIEK